MAGIIEFFTPTPQILPLSPAQIFRSAFLATVAAPGFVPGALNIHFLSLARLIDVFEQLQNFYLRLDGNIVGGNPADLAQFTAWRNFFVINRFVDDALYHWQNLIDTIEFFMQWIAVPANAGVVIPCRNMTLKVCGGIRRHLRLGNAQVNPFGAFRNGAVPTNMQAEAYFEVLRAGNIIINLPSAYAPAGIWCHFVPSTTPPNLIDLQFSAAQQIPPIIL